jgi:hypothetical protein
MNLYDVSMSKTIDHDQLFKQLIGTFFLDFLDLFVPELAVNIDRDNLEFLPQEYFTDIVEGESLSERLTPTSGDGFGGED